MSATDTLCEMLADRCEEFFVNDFGVNWRYYSDPHTATESMDGTLIVTGLTPEQAIAATLGNQYDCDDPEWVEWVDSLNHREVKNIRDAVEKLMYEAITLGGSMGPNDNVEDGWNEGTELTKAYIDSWVDIFATLGTETCYDGGYDPNDFVCSECGAHMFIETDDTYTMMTSDENIIKRPNYCPNCGARVVGVRV